MDIQRFSKRKMKKSQIFIVILRKNTGVLSSEVAEIYRQHRGMESTDPVRVADALHTYSGLSDLPR